MLDIRNNAIGFLPESIVDLKSLGETYLYDNPVCTNGWLDGHAAIKDVVERSPEAGCKKQCSSIAITFTRRKNIPS